MTITWVQLQAEVAATLSSPQEARWIIEADGRKWHERRRQMAKDSVRDTEAARCGHLTTRWMWEHLDSDPEGCAAALADIYRDRVALFAR